MENIILDCGYLEPYHFSCFLPLCFCNFCTTSFFSGIGAASKAGVLIKGGNYLEALAKVDTVVFDKTGTLTKGVFNVQKVVVYDENIDENEFMYYVASAESGSNHPISKSIQNTITKRLIVHL